MVSEYVKKALEFASMSQAKLARELTEKTGASFDRAAVNKMVAGTRDVSANELLAISRITGFPIPGERPQRRTVQVVGYAAAGADTIIFADGQGNIDDVDAPEWATERTVAVIVRGTSLGQLLDGWIAFYDDRRDPPESDLIGHVCICGLADGRVVIKRLKAGSAKGLFHLESAIEGTMFDQPVHWAAKVRELRPR